MAPERPAALLLADFARPGALARWEAGPGVALTRVPAPGRPGSRAARVAFPRNLHGIALRGVPRDWRSYRCLEIDVHAEPVEAGLALGVRVDDRASDAEPGSRFEAALVLAPGWNGPAIPIRAIGRRIDVWAVGRVVLYAQDASGAGKARTVSVGAIRLVSGHTAVE